MTALEPVCLSGDFMPFFCFYLRRVCIAYFEIKAVFSIKRALRCVVFLRLMGPFPLA